MSTVSYIEGLLLAVCQIPNSAKREVIQPWSIDRYSMAANGEIIIRVDRISQVSDNCYLESSSVSEIHSLPWMMADTAEMHPVSSIVIPEEKFTRCMECTDSTGKYKCKCEFCTGHTCRECNGTGRIKANERVTMGSNDISDKYVRFLATLPKCFISLTMPVNTPVPFKFEFGRGFVQPMRK